MWTLHSQLTKEKNWKKAKRSMSASTMLDNWENIKVTVISIVVGALGTFNKGLVKGLEDLEIRDRVETTKLQNCWDWPDTEKSPGDLLLKLQWKTIGLCWSEKLSIIIIWRRTWGSYKYYLYGSENTWIMEYSTLRRSPQEYLLHQILFNVISSTPYFIG